MREILQRISTILSRHSEAIETISKQHTELAREFTMLAVEFIDQLEESHSVAPENDPPETTADGRHILRSAAAAEYVGLKRQTLATFRLDGSGPAYIRLGVGPRGPVGYLKEDLDEWLESRRYNSTSHETVKGDK